MSAALEYFLDEGMVCEELEFPDRAIDFAFMLDRAEWQILLSKWADHSDAWKTAISYYAGFAYSKDSGPILLKALDDKNEEVKLQGLFSIYESLNSEIESVSHKKKQADASTENNPLNNFSGSDLQKIKKELEIRASDFDMYPELADLQNLIDQGA